MPKKTAAQLDREIDAALAEQHRRGAYYYTTDRGGRRTIYGPFSTQREAECAGYFAKSVPERDRDPAHLHFMRGVQRYDVEEIRGLLRYPDEYSLRSATLRAGPPPLHPSWGEFDEDFRTELRDRDYELYQRLASRSTR
jgi:hypothetical protein